LSHKKHLQKAKEIIDSGISEDYIYACLEFRFFIESYVYFELSKYPKSIPKKHIKDWQPARIIKTCQQLIPEFMSEYEVKLIKQDFKGSIMGREITSSSHSAPKVSKLTKLYHKLSNKLHVNNTMDINKDFLLDTYLFLEPMSQNNFWYATQELINFNCDECLRPIYINTKAEFGDKKMKVFCLAENCNATYIVTKDKDNFHYEQLKTNIKCRSCDNYIAVLDEEMSLGKIISCINCKSDYILGWGYTEKVD
tara:strand:- start:322 stop:1077 length:756 start_codon:yes stop_codon:yes gene_type:complete